MALTPLDIAVRGLANEQYGLFTSNQALRLGGTKRMLERRLKRGDIAAVADGVYCLPGALRTWRWRLHRALLVAGDGAAVSHRAAAALWRLPGFGEGPVDVLANHGRKNHRMVEGKLHESRAMPESHIARVDGLAVTTVERTLFDIAGSEHFRRADRAVENALARRLTTVAQLWAVWADLAAPNRPGTDPMRKILLKRGPGYVAKESELEVRFSELLDEAGIEQPDWQRDLGGDEWIGRVDCTFRRSRLLVEVDGRLGHIGEIDRARDRDRDNALMAEGWRVLRFTWDDIVCRPAWVVATLRRALAAVAA